MNFIGLIYYFVSVLSIALYVASVQFKSKKNILVTQFFASMCYLIVYLIKGAYSGAYIEVLEEVKDIVFIKYEKKGKNIPLAILIVFIVLLFIVSIIFYDGILSILPLLINIILFISTYYKNPKYIRWVMLLSGLMWGIYNIYVGAYVIVIGNILEVISAIIAILKFKDVDNNFDKKDMMK
ncbi:MAG: YgjV family protein [bacterium]|nr:YgjV family protein [bacterium]